MSYARKGPDSDVYVYSDGEWLHCMACWLDEDGNTVSHDNYPEMITHLESHRAKGHSVPDYALERLRKEAAISPSVAEVFRLDLEPE